VIIELDKPQQPIKFSINADSAVMNPQTKILALKGDSIHSEMLEFERIF